MEAAHLATPGHAHIPSDRDRKCGHSLDITTAFIESFSSIPAVEFSGTAHAVSLPFFILPMSEAAFLLSFWQVECRAPHLGLEGSLAAITNGCHSSSGWPHCWCPGAARDAVAIVLVVRFDINTGQGCGRVARATSSSHSRHILPSPPRENWQGGYYLPHDIGGSIHDPACRHYACQP